MVVCPLCEHAQEHGAECAVCGTRLAESGAQEVAIERLSGLELTRLETSSPLPPADRMEGLEPTLLDVAAVPAAPDDPAAWIERTAREPALAEAAEPLSIEPTACAPREAPSHDPFAPLLCRYCRTAAAPGELFCARCGLRLAVYSGVTVPAGDVAGDVRRCRFCGASAPGSACPACGARFVEA